MPTALASSFLNNPTPPPMIKGMPLSRKISMKGGADVDTLLRRIPISLYSQSPMWM